jgi:hypothetical protein
MSPSCRSWYEKLETGNRMTPSHTRKGNVRYRYYLSSAVLQGTPERAGSVRRVPATAIEALIIKSVREHLKPSLSIDDRGLVTTRIARIEVQAKQLIIQLTRDPNATPNRNATNVLRIPWQSTQSTRRREILLPDGTPPQHARPIRSETRATLVAAIARGRRWLGELAMDASITTDSIASREGCSARNQHDYLTRLPRPRSGQSCYRRPAPERHGHCPSHRLACRMVQAARDARLSVPLTQHSNRVSTNASLRRRETRFCGAETKAPKRP